MPDISLINLQQNKKIDFVKNWYLLRKYPPFFVIFLKVFPDPLEKWIAYFYF